MSEVADQFRSGRFAEAKQRLEAIVAEDGSQLAPWLMLALAAERLDDRDACASALERVLAIAPETILAWLIKGDLANRQGDRQTAGQAYLRAVLEARSQTNIPPDIRQRLAQAGAWLNAERSAQQSRFRDALTATGLRQAGSKRFQQSLDIALEGKSIYVQKPTVFYFSGLPQRQFFEREEFAWVEEVEARTEAIGRELGALLAERGLFTPHVVADDAVPSGAYRGLAGNTGWSSLYLRLGGEIISQNAARCPETMAALEAVPLCHLSNRGPSAPAVMFSMLRAGAKIPPHTGATNVRMICHLPLVVPPRCGFRVGNEVREWERGKLLIFDDTIEHEAWNESGEDRIVLIFDVWRPELTEKERKALTTFFQCREAARPSAATA